MARTAAGAELTDRQRRMELALRAAALRDLVQLWDIVDPVNLAGTIGRFLTAATILVRARHTDAAALAGRYYEAFAFVEGLTGEVPRIVARPPAAELVAAVLRGAGLSGIIAARRAGQSPQAAARHGLVKVSGSASSLVLGGARETITGMVERDRQALGWQRVTSGGPCAFCAMIASRGPVFKSERSASFAAHDHCACTAEPYYADSRPPAGTERLAQQWRAAQRQARADGQLDRGTANDALNAYRRYLAAQTAAQTSPPAGGE